MSSPASNVTNEGSHAADLAPREYFRLLAAARRRRALEALAETTDPVDLEELAADVARDDERDALAHVALDLHHAHLPMMAELGVLEYDPVDRRIDPTGVSLDDLAPTRRDR